MRIKYTLFIVAFLAISNSGFAQYAKDAVRFSTFQPGSTSRIKAVGGASTAVGGDLTSVSANPAGLGYFTHSEASLTPQFDTYNSKSTYLGQTGDAGKNNLNLNNAAIVFYSRLNTPAGQDKTKGWLSLNFGMGYSRTNSYDEQISYKSANNTNSITDYYAKLANDLGVSGGDLQSWARDQKLIDAYGSGSNYTYKSNSYPGVSQRSEIGRKGGESEFDFSVGANYSNKLYLGLGIGITQLKFGSTNYFYEDGNSTILVNNLPVNSGYSSLHDQTQATKGEGFNAKLGFIYKITENVRWGGLLTTPTFLTIDDNYTEGLTTDLTKGTGGDNGSSYPLTYTMRTPFKAATGLSVFLGNIGFITGDVEFIDYSTTRLNSNDDYTNTYDNGIIKSTYKSAVNLRAGAEIRLTSSLALRGGYGIQGTPLKTGGADAKSVTGGLGYRLGNYFVDATVMHITGAQNILQYDIGAPSPVANVNSTNNNFFLTIGYRY